MEKSAQRLIAQRLRAATDQVIATTKAMPEDKLRWTPMENGRCVLELLADCVHCSLRVAKIIQQRNFNDLPDAPDWQTTDLATFHELLRSSTEAYCEVVMSVPDEDLTLEFDAPWGGKLEVGGGMFHPYWNMTYHEGQINYIQTLYGDKEMHF